MQIVEMRKKYEDIYDIMNIPYTDHIVARWCNFNFTTSRTGTINTNAIYI